MDLLGNVSLGEYALVAGIAFFASILGGVAGYGTGLILPPPPPPRCRKASSTR